MSSSYSDSGFSSSFSSSSSLLTTSKWVIAVVVSLLVIGGIVAGLIFGGVFSSFTSDNPGDEPPIVNLPSQGEISEIRIGDTFSSKKLLGTDGSTAEIVNDILTITDPAGNTINTNGIKNLKLFSDRLEVNYSRATFAQTIFTFSANTLEPTSLEVVAGKLVLFAGETIVWTLASAGDVVTGVENIIADMPVIISEGNLPTYKGAEIYMGTFSEDGYCQSSVYEQMTRGSSGYNIKTDKQCIGVITGADFANAESLQITRDSVLYPKLIGPVLTMPVLIPNALTAIETKEGGKIIFIGVDQTADTYKMVLKGATAADDIAIFGTDVTPFTFPLNIDQTVGMFGFSNDVLGPSVSVDSITCYLNGFKYTLAGADTYYALSGSTISVSESSDGQFLIGDQNPLICKIEDDSGDSITHVTNTYSGQCYGLISTIPSKLTPDFELVFSTVIQHTQGIQGSTITNILSDSTKSENYIFRTETSDIDIRISGHDKYFYIKNISAGTMTKTGIYSPSLTLTYKSTPIKVASEIQVLSDGLIFLDTSANVVAFQSWSSNVITSYDGSKKDIYFGTTTSNCGTIVPTGVGFELASTVQNTSGTTDCYGSLPITSLTTDIFERYPLLFPKLIQILLLVNLSTFDETYGLVYGSANLDYLHLNNAGDLYRGTTLVVASFKTAINTVITANSSTSFRDIIATDTGIYLRDDKLRQLFYWADGAAVIDFSDGSLDILLKTDATQASDCLSLGIRSEKFIRYQNGECWFSLRETPFVKPLLYQESTQVFYSYQLIANTNIDVATFPIIGNNRTNAIVKGSDFWYRFDGDYPVKWTLQGHERYQITLTEFIDSAPITTDPVSIRFERNVILLYVNAILKQSISPLSTASTTLNPNVSKQILFNTGADITTCESFQQAGQVDTGIIDNNCWGELLTTPVNLYAQIPVFPNKKLTSFIQGDNIVKGDIIELNGGYTLMIDDGILYGYKPGELRIALAGSTNTTETTTFVFNNYPQLRHGITTVWPTSELKRDIFNSTSLAQLQVNTVSKHLKLVKTGEDIVDMLVNGSVTILVNLTNSVAGNIYFGVTTNSSSCQRAIETELGISLLETSDYFYNGGIGKNKDCYLALFSETLLTNKAVDQEPRLFPTNKITEFLSDQPWTSGTELHQSGRVMLFDQANGQIRIYSAGIKFASTLPTSSTLGPYTLEMDKLNGLVIKNNVGVDILNKPTNNINVRTLEISVDTANNNAIILATKNDVQPNLIIQSIFDNSNTGTTNGNYKVMTQKTTGIGEVFLDSQLTSSYCEDFAQEQGFDLWQNNVNGCYASSTNLKTTLLNQPVLFPNNLFLELTTGQTMNNNDQLESQDGSVVSVLNNGVFTIWARDTDNNWAQKWQLTGDIQSVTFDSDTGVAFRDTLGNKIFPSPTLTTINFVPVALVLNTVSFIPQVTTLNDMVIMDLADITVDATVPVLVFKNSAAEGTRLNSIAQVIDRSNSILLETNVTTDAGCKIVAENNAFEKYTIINTECYGSITTASRKLPVERVSLIDPKYTRVIGNYQLRISQDGLSPNGMQLLDANGITKWTSHGNVTVNINQIVDDLSGHKATIALHDDTQTVIWPKDISGTFTFTDQPLSTSQLEIESNIGGSVSRVDLVVRNRADNNIIRFQTDGALAEYQSLSSAPIASKLTNFTDIYKAGVNNAMSGPIYAGDLPSEGACADTSQLNRFEKYYWSQSTGCYGILFSNGILLNNLNDKNRSPSTNSISFTNVTHFLQSSNGQFKAETKIINTDKVRLYVYKADNSPLYNYTFNTSLISPVESLTGDITLANNTLNIGGFNPITFPVTMKTAVGFKLSNDGDFILFNNAGTISWSILGDGQFLDLSPTISGIFLTTQPAGSAAIASITANRNYNIKSLVNEIVVQFGTGLSATVNTTSIDWVITGVSIDLTQGIFRAFKKIFGFSITDTTLDTTRSTSITVAVESKFSYIYLDSDQQDCAMKASSQGLDTYFINNSACYGGISGFTNTYFTSLPLFKTPPFIESTGYRTFRNGNIQESTSGRYKIVWSSDIGSLSFFDGDEYKWNYTFTENGELQLIKNNLQIGSVELTEDINTAINCDNTNANCKSWEPYTLFNAIPIYDIDFVTTKDGLTTTTGLWKIDQNGIHIKPLLYDDFSLFHFETKEGVPVGFSNSLSIPQSPISIITDNILLDDYQPFIIKKDAQGNYYHAKANRIIYKENKFPDMTKLPKTTDTFAWGAITNSCSTVYNDTQNSLTLGNAILANGLVVCLKHI